MITIVILVILATISLNLLFNKNGIIKQAQIAKQIYENDSKQEEQQMKDLEKEINYITNKWVYDQKKQSITNGSVKLEIGDYINYNCHLENEEIYESKAEMNGYANQKFSSNSYSGAWRVFGADSSGNLLIISESAISPDEGGYTNEIYNTIGFGMHGNLAYINAITEINNVCAIYGKGDKAVKAKSVTAEEINRITGYNADIANFKDVSIPSCQYNNEVTYTLESGGISCIGTKYPTASVKSTGVSSFTYLSGNQWKNLNQGEKIKIKNTVYGYFADTLTNNEDDEIKGIKTTSNAYKLLFNNRNDGIYNKKDPTPRGSGYWIATTGTWTDTDTARYGLFVASYGIGVNTLYFSNNEKKPSFPQSQCIRPVVTLESDIQLIDSQKTKDGCKIWNIR